MKPAVISPVTANAYVPGPSVPVITSVVTSSTVYATAVVEPAYLGRLVHVYVQFPSAFNVAEAGLPVYALPSASKLIVTESGLIASWLSPSDHTLVTFTDTTSGVCVLVTVYPSACEPVILIAYVPGPSVPVITAVLTSSTVYSIAVVVPAYLGRFSQVYVHVPSVPNVTDAGVPVYAEPFASKLIVTVSGLIASWLLPSTHSLVTVTVVTSGV